MKPSFQPFQVEKYLLFERLAAGGMAEVYLARLIGAAAFSKHVAIKRILPDFTTDPTFKKMFEQEAELSSCLNHANIVQTFDFLQQKDGYFLVMEFINGKNLREVLEKIRAEKLQMPFEMAVFITLEICKGLEYAHSKKDESGRLLRVLHRDISPHNIMIGYDGSVKIVDFGLAKAKDGGNSTQTGTLKGKFPYMSPEQAHCEPLDGRTDVYSTGLVLYELLTQERAYQGKTEVQMLKAAQECLYRLPQEVNPKISLELQAILLKALEKDQEKRFQTAGDFGRRLQEYLVQKGSTTSQSEIAAYMESLFEEDIQQVTQKLSAPLPAVTPPQPSGPSRNSNPSAGKISQPSGEAPYPIRKLSDFPSQEPHKIGMDQLFFVLKLIGITFFALLGYKKFGDDAKRELANIMAPKPPIQSSQGRESQ